MILNRDIIVLGLQPWDIEIGSNCKNIAIEFAKNNRVLYVNAPLDRISSLKQRNKPQIQKRLRIIKGKEEDLIQLSNNLWNLYPRTILESISQLPFNSLFDFFNRINNKRFAQQIKSAINRLQFKDFIVFNDSDMFRSFYMKELLKPDIYIYYSRDNLLAVDFWKKQGTRIEPVHMKKADVVVTNSLYLTELAKKYNSKSFYVGQGCDVSLYDKKKIDNIPYDISEILPPIIGYTGALYTLRLNIDVIRYIADKKPEWNIVLVGPEDDTFKNSELHTFKNVYFTGNKKPEELPAYVNKFDVAINPQFFNEVTRGNYPRKVDEYLALGKPVVATETEAMAAFNRYVYLARSASDYVELIDKAIKENTPEREHFREQFAKAHTWENNVKEIWKAVERTGSRQ